MSGRRTRVALLVAALCALAIVAAVALWPGRIDGDGRGVYRLVILLHERGVPYWVDYALLERGANVALFVPVGAILAAILPLRRWWLALALAVGASVALEALQLLVAARMPSAMDVAMNAIGAAVGVAAVTAWRALRARNRRRAARSPVESDAVSTRLPGAAPSGGSSTG